MKRIILCGLALLGIMSSALAQTEVGLYFPSFTLAANEEKEVTLNLSQDPSNPFVAVQADLVLPKGVTVASDENGYWAELSPYHVGSGRSATGHQLNFGWIKSTQCFRILVTSMSNKSFIGEDGEFIVFKFTTSDSISTGSADIKLKNVKTSYKNAPSIFTEESTFHVDLTINANIGKGGYGSFSWPRALDFSESGAQVFVATDYKDGIMTLQSVDDGKVPANTGIVIKGDASTTVHPQTIDEEPTLALANILASTAKETIDGDGASIYALATKSKGTGFYRVGSGVTIPKYKAYLVADGSSQGAADVFLFDETTGISSLAADGAEGITFTLSGIQVKAPAQKGIYIKNGKKVILK